MPSSQSIASLSFKRRKPAKAKRAAFYVRWGRLLARKRVAYARRNAAHAMKVAQRELDRTYQLARIYGVPMADTGPMPVLPTLPGQKWVDHLEGMGDLKAPVKPEPQADPAT